jgi:uncharacterized membrane protein (DUF106 family)
MWTYIQFNVQFEPNNWKVQLFLYIFLYFLYSIFLSFLYTLFLQIRVNFPNLDINIFLFILSQNAHVIKSSMMHKLMAYILLLIICFWIWCSHVRISGFNTHIKSRKITFLLFYYLLQIGYYNVTRPAPPLPGRAPPPSISIPAREL